MESIVSGVYIKLWPYNRLHFIEYVILENIYIHIPKTNHRNYRLSKSATHVRRVKNINENFQP